MNKKELIKKAAARSGMPQVEMEKAMNTIMEIIGQSLEKEESVVLLGFGTFQVRERAARQGHNPVTKQPMQIPAKKLIKFKPSSKLKIDSKK